MRALGDNDYLLIGSEERNVDLQENARETKERLLALAAAAIAQGRLVPVFSGEGDAYRLFEIQREDAKKK